MIRFTSKLASQNKPGGWTYLIVAATHVKKLKTSKKTFRVKGTLDDFPFKHTSLLPLGNGSHFLPFNATMRKGTGKKAGDKVAVVMELDKSKPKLSRDLLQCLKEDPAASAFFKTLTSYMQYYYSNWIESAKSSQTKTRRLVAVVNSLAKKQNHLEMMEAYRNTMPFTPSGF